MRTLNWTGALFIAGGVLHSLLQPELKGPFSIAPVGFWFALVGAGVLDPKPLLGRVPMVGRGKPTGGPTNEPGKGGEDRE